MKRNELGGRKVSQVRIDNNSTSWVAPLMTTRLTRRGLLKRAITYGSGFAALGAIGTVLDACGSSTSSSNGSTSAKAMTPVSLQLNWLENVEFAGILLALHKGYYRDENIALSIAPLGPTTDPVDLVASGKAMIGMESGGDSVIIARSKGIPIKSFASDLQTDPSAWMTLKTSGITQMSQLRGKTVGIQAPDLQEVPLILGLGGLTTQDVSVKTVSFDPSVLVDHEVDAFSVFVTNEPITLEQQGIGVDLIPWSAYGFTYYSDCFFATDSTVKSNPGLLKSFVRATQRGWTEVFADPSAAVSLVLDVYGHGTLVERQQLAELHSQMPLMHSSFSNAHGLLAVSTSYWQSGIDLLARYKLIARSFPASDLCIEGLVEA
ncbi:MAG: ABC transporter substrate-binding protein [Actinomycetota bacterium]|nr:ABC transporter substrate-binding protein [Actinomycetota bacterium]